MGMFDDVKCEVPVPGEPKPKHQSFQTKDFDCLLDHYTIRADGTLWKHAWDDGVKSEPVQVPFHGMLNFYTLEHIQGSGSPGREDHWWFEYEAKFTDGVLQEIKPVQIRLSRWGEKAQELRNAVEVSER